MVSEPGLKRGRRTILSGYYSRSSIVTLVARESHRRKGVGWTLMSGVHDRARERGLREVELDVYEFNGAAIELYEALGYETVRRKMRKQLAD